MERVNLAKKMLLNTQLRNKHTKEQINIKKTNDS